MPRMVDLGVTTYYWVPTIADVSAPTTSEITAGTNISEYVVTSTSIQPSASDTVNERSVVDTANVVVPTVGNYEGTLVLFRDFDATGTVGTNDLLAEFDAGTVGYIVRRVGKPSDEAVAASDVVDVFKFMADNPQVNGGTGEGYLKATIPLLQQGQFKVGATVAAGV